jgi:predicted permease
MQAPEAKGQRMVALFILGCLLFNYPVLSLFNVAADVLGVPVLYAYIFAAWALLVALMALVVESRR